MTQHNELEFKNDIKELKKDVKLMSAILKELISKRMNEDLPDDCLSDDDFEALSDLTFDKKNKKLLSLKEIEKELGI